MIERLCSCWLLAAAACADSACDLVADLQARAGNDAMNCGEAAVGADHREIDACVVAAFEARRPFFARYERQGVDSEVVFGIAGDGTGRITFLFWDGDPSGGSGADPVISATICEGAKTEASDATPLGCATTKPLGRVCE